MVERTAKALADALEPKIEALSGKEKRMNFVCESEDESVLLAHELRKRGWETLADTGIAGLMTGEPRTIYAVVITGRVGEQKKKAARRAK